jgi:hypothetical protein
MPVNDIIKHAIDNNPLKVQGAFEDEMKNRVRTALNTKYQSMTSETQPEHDVEEIDVHSGQEVED